jgi:hypothetical protein
MLNARKELNLECFLFLYQYVNRFPAIFRGKCVVNFGAGEQQGF